MAATTEFLDNVENILTTYGYVVIPDVTDSNFNNRAITEIIDHLTDQPRVEGREIVVKQTTNISSSTLKILKKAWVPHVQSGIVHEPPAFHMTYCWKVRKSPLLTDIYRRLLSTDDLRPSLEPYTALLPKEGSKQRLYFDENRRREKCPTYFGKLALTTDYFYCVPGSHTAQFHESLSYHYSYLEAESLNSIDRDRDPWNLDKLEVKVMIPPGHFLIRHKNLLMSSYKNTDNNIRFGYSITYTPPNNSSLTDEERELSFQTGRAPPKNVYGLPIDYMPKAWKSFPSKVYEYWERLPEDRKHQRLGKNNKSLPCIVEPDDFTYQLVR